MKKVFASINLITIFTSSNNTTLKLAKMDNLTQQQSQAFNFLMGWLSEDIKNNMVTKDRLVKAISRSIEEFKIEPIGVVKEILKSN